jgi:hypothetical protein
MDKAEEVVKTELQKYEDQEQALQVLAAELQQNPKFAQFLEAQKSFSELQATVWKNIETVMLENNIKSIKTDKVTLSIAERTSFDIDLDLLPAKFIKRVPDTTKILGTFKLEGKPVKGTTPKYTQYLVKRIK